MTDNQREESVSSQSKGANLDHITCGCGVIYMIGWGFNGRDDCGIIEVFLHKDGLKKPVQVPVEMQFRPDVVEYFSLSSRSVVGFSVQVSLSNYDISAFPSGEYRVVICATGSDNSKFEKEVGVVSVDWPEAIQSIEFKSELCRKLTPKRNGLLQKMWHGKLGADEMLRKIYYATEITAENMIEAAHLIASDGRIAAMVSDSPTLRVVNLLKSASINDGLIVIFDHNFGGGANAFSGQVIKEICQNHNVVMRVWYEPSLSKFLGVIYYNGEHYDISVGELNTLFQLLITFPSHCLQINSLYTWPYIESVLDNIVRLRIYNFTKRLEFFAHDHIGICPSLFLLNEDERYCAVPENLDACSRCLQNNTDAFKVFYKQEDVALWRRSWHSVLLNADYIRFFSQATNSEYLKAFPNLVKSSNVVIKGHNVNTHGCINIENRVTDGITRIGIFGFLGVHKGSRIVWQLAESIARQSLPIHIHVFGKIDGLSKVKSDTLTIHGPYDCENMVKLWDFNQIDVAFVPSICPETFSLVTAELIQANAPIISFNIGAQANLVSEHDLGDTIPLPHEMPVLESILNVMNNRQLN